jgi:drug/metabolite transporter (DMT)-like permease
VLVWPELSVGGRDGLMFVAGVVSLQVAGVGWALGTSYLKRNPTNGSPMGSLAVQMLLSGVMLMGIATITGEWARLHFTTRSFAAMAYLVVFGSLIGYSAYMYALKNLPVSTVQLYAYVNPIIAVLLGWLVLNEPFTARIAVASLLVFAGIAVVKTAPRAATPAESTTAATAPADPYKEPGRASYATQ